MPPLGSEQYHSTVKSQRFTPRVAHSELPGQTDSKLGAWNLGFLKGPNKMAVDVDPLVAPLSDDAPAGPDLSYDGARQEIEAAFERSVSDDGSGEDEIDWPQIVSQILAQASRPGMSGCRFT